MTALLDIDQLLDTLESGLRQILQARGVDDPVAKWYSHVR